MFDHAAPSPTLLHAARVLWDYHRLDHPPRPVDAALGLGSHDPGVARQAAELHTRGLFDLLVFSGATSPTTAARFPRGEAVHYREIAIEHGVAPEAIRVEPHARHTGENFAFARRLLADEGVHPTTLMVISRPYQQRRAYATCLKLWPDVEPVCVARHVELEDYIAEIADPDRVLTMLVGDTQRITVYAERGFAAPQPFPTEVAQAFEDLVAAGYTGRLIPDA
jgi:uncharacterized SAM-binding protein YcdF (DUF218 family)